jgi:hypothetical protein
MISFMISLVPPKIRLAADLSGQGWIWAGV